MNNLFFKVLYPLYDQEKKEGRIFFDLKEYSYNLEVKKIKDVIINKNAICIVLEDDFFIFQINKIQACYYLKDPEVD